MQRVESRGLYEQIPYQPDPALVQANQTIPIEALRKYPARAHALLDSGNDAAVQVDSHVYDQTRAALPVAGSEGAVHHAANGKFQQLREPEHQPEPLAVVVSGHDENKAFDSSAGKIPNLLEMCLRQIRMRPTGWSRRHYGFVAQAVPESGMDHSRLESRPAQSTVSERQSVFIE